MAKAHFGSRISPNMKRTPEDFLICYNVPIARTGVQKYLGKELGLKDRPDDIIKVYRTENEVFSPKTIASFEGKVFVDEHPNDWVTPLNFQTYGKGTITNVRRGTGKEEDLLLADIIVYSLAQIEEIETKQKREVSCGYECEYVPYKDGYMQKNIVGNHVALVNAGRAGSRVAIRDNKLNEQKEGGNKRMDGRSYRIPKRQKASEFLQAVGLKHVAQDADPEDILDAMNELIEERKANDEEEKNGVEQVSQVKTGEPVAKDEEIEEMKEALTDVKDALHELLKSRAKDEEMEEKEPDNEGMESLDELEEELEEDSEIEEVESVEEPAEEMNEDGCEEMQSSESVKDSAVELMRVLKPIISYIPDKKERKRVSDNLAKVLRKQVKDAKAIEKRKNDSPYSEIMKARERSNVNDKDYANSYDFGRMIAEKFNPHYKKEVK